MFCIAEGAWSASSVSIHAPVVPLGTRLLVSPRLHFGFRRYGHGAVAFERAEDANASALANDARWHAVVFLPLIRPDDGEVLTFIASTRRRVECIITLPCFAYDNEWLPGQRPAVELARNEGLLRDEVLLAPEDRNSDCPIYFPRFVYHDDVGAPRRAVSSDRGNTKH